MAIDQAYNPQPKKYRPNKVCPEQKGTIEGEGNRFHLLAMGWMIREITKKFAPVGPQSFQITNQKFEVTPAKHSTYLRTIQDHI